MNTIYVKYDKIDIESTCSNKKWNTSPYSKVLINYAT